MTRKQLEIGLKSGTVIYVPVPESEDDIDTVIANLLYADYFIQLSNIMEVEQDYYIRKDCIEYFTVNDETPKKTLLE